MLTVNIHEAKTQLSKLIAMGEPFIIAKAGIPKVKVVPIETPEDEIPDRLGFMAGKVVVPDDFDQMGESEVLKLFGIEP